MNYVLLYMLLVLYVCTGHAHAGGITYTQESTLDFGSITKQTGLDITSTASPAGNNRGQLLIKDNTSSDTINITFQGCGPGNDKVHVKDFLVTYGGVSWAVAGNGPFTQSGLQNPGTTGMQLRYGATLVVTKDAKTGSISPCFDIITQHDCAGVSASCATDAQVFYHDSANVMILGSPVTLQDVQQMDFGPIVKPSSNSTVTINPDGTMNVTYGNAVLLDGNTGQAAQFDITAEKDTVISVYATSGAGVNGLILENITTSFNGGGIQNINNSNNSKTFTTSATGTNRLQVGASLGITPGNLTPGVHTIGYDITIDYQ